MSKSEILQELPKLGPEERRDILDLLCELDEQDLLKGVGPTTEEKAMLDREFEDFQKRPNVGSSLGRSRNSIAQPPNRVGRIFTGGNGGNGGGPRKWEA